VPVDDPHTRVRGLHLAPTVLPSGTVAFGVLVAGPALRETGADGGELLARRLTMLVWTALAVAILSGWAWLTLISANILDVPPFDVWRDGAIWPVITGIRYGQIACLRLVAALLLTVSLALPPRLPGLQAAQLAMVAVLAGSLAFVGHAGAAPDAAGWFLLGSDLLHLFAASAWLGGLPALALLLAWSRGSTGPAANRCAALATARFSRLGIICVGTIVGSGLFNSWELLTGLNDLLTTTYGRVLSLKVGLFLAIVAVAAYNRYRLTPRLPAPGAVTSLQRNSLIEAGLGLGVLMLVGALGTMIPGGHIHPNAAPTESTAAFVHIHAETVMADVTIDPGQPGKSTAVIRLANEDSTVFTARLVRITLALREGGGPTIERTAEPSPDGTWAVTGLAVPHAGVWTIRVLIDTGRGPPVVLDAPIVFTQCSNEC
jgi:putative copper resistance protein D